MKYCYKKKGAGVLIACLLLVCLLPFSLSAQDVKQFPVNKVKKNHFLYVIGGEENNVFASSTQGNYLQPETKLPAMHINLGEENDTHEEIIKPGSRADILYTFSYAGKLLTLEYGNNPMPNGMYMLRLAVYNNKLALEQNITDTVFFTSALFRYDLGSVFRNYLSSQSGKWRRSYIFSHKASPDGEKALVMLDNPFQRVSPHQLYFFTIDKGLSGIRQHELSLPAEESHMLIEDYALAGDGMVYLLAAGFDDDRFKKQPNSFQYHFFKFDPQQKILEEQALDTDQHFVTNLGLTIGRDNQPMLAGLYSQDDGRQPEGTVLYRADESGSLQPSFQELDKAIAEQLQVSDKGASATVGINEYAVRYIFPEENGDLTFFAEHYSRKLGVGAKLSLIGGISAEPQLEDHYGNILAVRLQQDGPMAWSKVIPKNQRSVDENIMFNSFALCRKGEVYGLAFNEEVKNMSNVKWVEVNGQGDVSEKMIFDRKTDRLRIAPMLAGSTRQGQLLVPAMRFGSSMLVSIDF